MLINWAKEENEEEAASEQPSAVSSGYHSHEYQTASELFDYMARHHNFDVEANNSLTARDLVILYENIEIGTKLISHAKVKQRRPNQLVETIVYNDDQSDSEDSENYSNEDLLHMCQTNIDTLDMLNCSSVLDNTLCHKVSNMHLENNHLSSEYNRHFVLNDPYIKAQLKNLRLTTRDCDNAFPTSLLDYLCCKRLEDNYNIYMDNIIRYVTHTIDQLKRISNGDYLTEKAKQKWREVAEDKRTNKSEKDMKVLATSTSFPLRIETKLTGLSSMWDDIVRSEVDIRSLTKILEKKLIIEVPKLISGSYKLLSKQCADNLIISCETQDAKEDKTESRVDVVLQLERSDSGQIVSNINSIMILQATTANIPSDFVVNKPIALPYKNTDDVPEDTDDDKYEMTAIEEVFDDKTEEEELPSGNNSGVREEGEDSEYEYEQEQLETLDLEECQETTSTLPAVSSTDSTINFKEIITSSEANLLSNDSPSTLHMTMQNFEVLDTLLEEPVKKKSQTKVRIKSPYENNSHIIEEKKRRRLLEIKEKREKRKMAANGNSKISKNKYTKGAVAPQASSSVTKLSITNKSFYNSIYGHFSSENNSINRKVRNLAKRDSVPEISLGEAEVEVTPKNILTPDKNSLKFIDRSYYLDNTVTVMDLQNKQIPETDRKSDSTSEGSNSTKLLNINLLSELIESFTDTIGKVQNNQPNEELADINKLTDDALISDSTTSAEPLSEVDARPRNKTIATLECRKSIEKIYNLMKKSTVARNVSIKAEDTMQLSDSLQTDSATTISNKIKTKNATPKKAMQRGFKDDDKAKANKKVVVPPGRKTIPENPLKAISQILHEFDNVKKTRQKVTIEPKVQKKPPEIIKDSKINLGRRRPQTDEQIDEKKQTDRYSRLNFARDKRVNRSTPNVDSGRTPSPRISSPNRTNSPKRNLSPKRSTSPKKPCVEDSKKRIADLIDEVKEAKGEAVKGPPRLNSARLNALAQPKKSYVMAHSEEYQSRYGRNLMADRLDRLAAASDRHNVRNKQRRNTNEVLTNAPQKTNNANHSDTRKRSSPRNRSPTKQNHGNVSNARETIKVINVEETKPISKRELVVPLDMYSRSGKQDDLSVKSRTPYVPHSWNSSIKHFQQSKHFNLTDGSQHSSLTNSSDMGLMLHKLINKIITSEYVVASCDDTCGSIGRKTESLLETDTEDFEYPLIDNLNVAEPTSAKRVNKMKNTASPSSTVIEYFSDSSQSHYTPFESSIFARDEDNFTASSSGVIDKELEKLEHALARKMSTSTFQNRLRMKTLTLTPIQSSPQTMIVESGDASSLAVQAKTSQVIDIQSLHPYETSVSNATSLKKQQKNVAWGFTHTQIPMQLYTVGYALPQYNTQVAIRPLEVRSIHSNISCKILDEIVDVPVFHVANSESGHTIDSMAVMEAIAKHKDPNNYKHVIEKNEILNDENGQDKLPKETADSGTLENVQQIDDTMKEEGCSINKMSGNLLVERKTDQSNSLDVLVGLLDEIKKLTECQTQITDCSCQKKEQVERITTAYREQESVENIFNNSSKFNEDLLVHQVETDTSLNIPNNILVDSQYLTKNLSLVDIQSHHAIYIDKKVSVDFFGGGLVNKTTDIPSQICNITVTRSTTITQSMVNILQNHSSQRERLSDRSVLTSESLIPSEKVIELQNYDYETDDSKKTDLLETEFETANVAISTDNAKETNRELMGDSTEIDIPTQDNRSDTVAAVDCHGAMEALKHDSEATAPAKKMRKTPKRVRKSKTCVEAKVKSNVEKRLAKDGHVVKLKRDVLVTMYSLLVITVFAALSLPELIYRT